MNDQMLDHLRPVLKKLADNSRTDAMLEAAEFLDARAQESHRTSSERHVISCCAEWLRDLSKKQI